MYKKILAIKIRAMGDTVLMTAALNELRRRHTHAEIHVVVTDIWASLLENHPSVTKVWKYTRHEEKTARARAIARLGLQLRREKFDCVVGFHASPSIAILAYSTGADVRSIHFHGLKDKNRYSTVEIPGKGVVKPIIERDMDAIRALGISIPEGKLPQLVLTDDELEKARQIFKKRELQPPILALALGASRPAKIWPLERFAELASLWYKTTKGSVITVTSNDEQGLVDEYKEALAKQPTINTGFSDRTHSFTDLDARQLVAVLKLSSVLVGNDSGPRHLAVAVNTPTVTMIGPENPIEWHPYPRTLHPYLYAENLPCRSDALPGMPAWCGLQTKCIEKEHRCMKLISVEQVFTETRRVSHQ
ncbi:MAG: glycosyltransferase family 9 protein [Xanthomonadaceae bacterium]|nr:glycosyltransferase family 9 protein [Xanthomonadaceae bacterium]